ncbi:MAG TPA: adenylate/guanylate cyclase domain-containing protein [Anaerolineales bacterium]|nr:adenylate/guanylate cyclase domain-containing protein [Anaerolineales bacterium]
MDIIPVLSRLDAFLNRFGVPPSATNDERINRGVILGLTVLTFAAGLGWGTLYARYGEPAAASIPFGYAALTLANLIGFVLIHKRSLPFSFVQLLLILLLPFLLMAALGGFVRSSAVILWSIVAPLGALLLFGRRAAISWFIAYFFLCVLSGFLEPQVPVDHHLPQGVVIIFFVLNICAPILCAFLLLHYFVGEKNRAYELLGLEREKSERLLLNVLPRAIADLLKEHNRQIARHFDEVTVLFADLAGFTELSETMRPRETVDLLNEVFTYFDRLVERYGVEKIRTVGDGYMAAAGVPVPMPDHAIAMANLALEMVDYIDGHRNGRLQIRIGMNSGEAVAGIVGTTKFHYDLWGDAVNIAARMESHGVPGKIQIARGSYERIKDRFACTSRGQVDIKGKGPMETWFLSRAN